MPRRNHARHTDVMIAGKTCFIAGYGDVGKGCAKSMQAQGANVLVSEIDPICALLACMEGFKVAPIEEVLETADIFITSTGNFNIIMAEHMSKMKNNAIVGNIGHFDNEIDMAGVENWPGIKRQNIKPQVDRFIFPDGHGVIILAEGRLMNLGCATGQPSFVMSCSFTDQVIAQLAAGPGGVGAQEPQLHLVRHTRPPEPTAARSRCAFRALSVPSDCNRSPRGASAG